MLLVQASIKVNKFVAQAKTSCDPKHLTDCNAMVDSCQRCQILTLTYHSKVTTMCDRSYHLSKVWTSIRMCETASGRLRVDGVQDTFISNLGIGNQADLGAHVPVVWHHRISRQIQWFQLVVSMKCAKKNGSDWISPPISFKPLSKIQGRQMYVPPSSGTAWDLPCLAPCKRTAGAAGTCKIRLTFELFFGEQNFPRKSKKQECRWNQLLYCSSDVYFLYFYFFILFLVLRLEATVKHCKLQWLSLKVLDFLRKLFFFNNVSQFRTVCPTQREAALGQARARPLQQLGHDGTSMVTALDMICLMAYGVPGTFWYHVWYHVSRLITYITAITLFASFEVNDKTVPFFVVVASTLRTTVSWAEVSRDCEKWKSFGKTF